MSREVAATICLQDLSKSRNEVYEIIGCGNVVYFRGDAGKEARKRASQDPIHPPSLLDSLFLRSRTEGATEPSMAAVGEPGGLRRALEARLRDLGIAALIVEHPEVFTVEEMMPYVQHLKGAHSKNLFLKDKKKKSYWLVTALHNRQISLNDLAKKLGIGSGNLRFADEAAMLEKLKVGQGCVTPLALFCDEGDVKLVLDASFLEGSHETLYFHPMTNAATMGLHPDDFLKFLKSTGHEPIIVHFDETDK